MSRSNPARPLMLLAGLAVVALVLVWKGSEGPEAGRARHASSGAGDEDPALVASGGAGSEEAASNTGPVDEPRIEIPPWPVGEAEVVGAPDGRVYVKLVDHAGTPLPEHPIETEWWRGFGVNGYEAGATDAEGRYRTSANEVWQLESVAIPSPRNEVPHTYHAGPFAAAPDAPYEVVVQLPLTCLIRGRVLDLKGLPRGGEPVVCSSRRALYGAPFLHRLGTDEQEAQTSEDGTFEFLVLAGHHQIEFLDDSAFVVPMHADVHVSASRRRADVTLRLRTPVEGRPLTVHVSGFQGDGDGVEVTALSDEPVFGTPEATAGVRYQAQRTFFGARRQADGSWLVPQLPKGAWQVGVMAPGRKYARVDVPSGAHEVDVVLEPEPKGTRVVRIVGRLPDGRTTTPARQVYERGGGWLVLHGQDEGTELELDLRQAEPIHVVVREAGYALAGVGPLEAESAPERIEVQLEPAQEAQVEVVDADGNPVAATVQLRPSWRLFQTLDGATAKAGFVPEALDLHRVHVKDGRARFRDLGSTPYLVSATPIDSTLPPARGVVRGGETLRLVLGTGIDGLVSLRGQVLHATTGEPLRDAVVSAWTLEKHGEATRARCTTDGRGRFVIHGLARQYARFQVKHALYARPAQRSVDLRTFRGALEIRVHPARYVPVRIVDADGRPVPKAVVFARWSTGERVELRDAYGNPAMQEVETEAGGRVDLRGIPASRVYLMIRGPDEDADLARAHELDLREPVRGLVKLVLD